MWVRRGQDKVIYLLREPHQVASQKEKAKAKAKAKAKKQKKTIVYNVVLEMI